MSFLTTLLTSLFANNIILAGHGLKDGAYFHKKKSSWILVVLFFGEALILGACGLGFRALASKVELIKYLSILFFVAISILCDVIFYIIAHYFFKDDIKQDMKDESVSIAINSALLAISMEILLLTDASLPVALASIIGLPLGFIGATYVCGPVVDRLDTADQPKGFRGLPLLIISLAGLALAMSSLHF